MARLKSVQYEQVQKRFLSMATKYHWLSPDFPLDSFSIPEASLPASSASTHVASAHVVSLLDSPDGKDEGWEDPEEFGEEVDEDNDDEELPPFYHEEAKKQISFSSEEAEDQILGSSTLESQEEEEAEAEESESEYEDAEDEEEQMKPRGSRKTKVISEESDSEERYEDAADELATSVAETRLEDSEEEEEPSPEIDPSNRDGFDWEISFSDNNNHHNNNDAEEDDPTDRTFDLTKSDPTDPTDQGSSEFVLGEDDGGDSPNYVDDLDDYYSSQSSLSLGSDSPLRPPFSDELPQTPRTNPKGPAVKGKENFPATPKNQEPSTPKQTPKATPKPTPKASKQFQEDRDMFAYHLYHEYNQNVFESKLPDNMKITWSVNLKTTAGRSLLRKRITGESVVRESEIELSTKVLDSLERLRQTLAHEMCHVAAFLINHVESPPHGQHFKYWGARVEQRYPDLHVTTCHNYEINFKFNFLCTAAGCTRVYGRHSNSVDLETARCTCGGRLMREEKLKKDGTPHKARAPNAWQEYMKENLGKTKENHPRAPHHEIMAILKEQYHQNKTDGKAPSRTSSNEPIWIDD